MVADKFIKMVEEQGYGRTLAAYLALGARNGMEDLHAAGAFTDDEAPALNRGLRNALFEGWTADDALFVHDPPARGELEAWYMAYYNTRLPEPISNHLAGTLAGRTDLGTTLASICWERALRFAETKGSSPGDAEVLADAAVRGMAQSYKSWHDVVGREEDPSEEAMMRFSFSFISIPDYWEPAQLSTEFSELLAEQ